MMCSATISARSIPFTRCLEIISEASRRLPDELKARHQAIQWRDMAAAGNVYRHHYDDVAAREVWDTLHLHLPPLFTVIEQELAGLGGVCDLSPGNSSKFE